MIAAPLAQREGVSSDITGTRGGEKMRPTPVGSSQERGESFFLVTETWVWWWSLQGWGFSFFFIFFFQGLGIFGHRTAPSLNLALLQTAYNRSTLLTSMDSLFLCVFFYLGTSIYSKWGKPFFSKFLLCKCPAYFTVNYSQSCQGHCLRETTSLIGLCMLLHIPLQREAPCFYMNEHGWVVRRLSGETGSICNTQ